MRGPVSLALIGVPLLAFFWAGCATSPPPASTADLTGAGAGGNVQGTDPSPPERGDPFAPLVEDFRRKATDLEKRDLPREALEKWRVVVAFSPDDGDAVERAAALEERLKKSAESRFHRGRKLLERGEVKAARREFLLSLAEDPDHAGALEYVKNRIGREFRVYTLEEGDSLEGVATRVYNDPETAFLIARLNDIKPGEALPAGRSLKLPLLEETARGEQAGGDLPPEEGTVPAATEDEAGTVSMAERMEEYNLNSEPPPKPTELAMARDYLEGGSYDEAITVARAIPPDGPEGQEAAGLINAASYGLGRKLRGEKRFQEALDSFREVDPAFRDVGKQIAAVEKSLREKAEEHYLAGVKFFIDQMLERAIVEWEKTLELDPGHPKAKKDLAKARNLLEELKKIR